MMFNKEGTDKTNREDKGKVTDPIFKELFSDKKYLLQLYRDLHPEDEKATADDITDVTLEQVIYSKLNKLYNYLGFKVGSRLLLVFTLPGWIELNYVGNCALTFMPDSIKRLVESFQQDMSGNENSELSMPELYMVYADSFPEEVPEILSLSGEHFISKNIPVLFQPDDKTIIGQYIFFWREFDEQIYRYGYSMEAIKYTFENCKKNNILTEYIANRKQEVTEIIFDSFDPEDIAEAKFIQKEMEAHDKEVIEQGELNAARRMAKGLIIQNISLEIIEKGTGLSMDELKKIEAKMKVAQEAAEELIKEDFPLEKIGEWTKLSMNELKQIEAEVKADGDNK